MGLQLLPVGRHISAPLDNLPNQFIACKAYPHMSQIRATNTTDSFECMTVTTLLVLQHRGTDQLPRCTPLDEIPWYRLPAPGIHGGGSRPLEADKRQCDDQ